MGQRLAARAARPRPRAGIPPSSGEAGRSPSPSSARGAARAVPGVGQEVHSGPQRSERRRGQDPLEQCQPAPPVRRRIGAVAQSPGEAEDLLQEPDLQLGAVGLGQGADVVASPPVAGAEDVVVGQVPERDLGGSPCSSGRQWPTRRTGRPPARVVPEAGQLGQGLLPDEARKRVPDRQRAEAATASDSAAAATARRRRRAQRSRPDRQGGSRAKASGRSSASGRGPRPARSRACSGRPGRGPGNAPGSTAGPAGSGSARTGSSPRRPARGIGHRPRPAPPASPAGLACGGRGSGRSGPRAGPCPAQ